MTTVAGGFLSGTAGAILESPLLFLFYSGFLSVDVFG
jgi:hypothetical protein